MIGERAVPAMKCGIEAGNLRDVRKLSKDRADGRKIVRLVQRSERNATLEIGEHAVVDQDRRFVLRSAMDHPMPHGNRFDGVLVTKPCRGAVQRRSHVRNLP